MTTQTLATIEWRDQVPAAVAAEADQWQAKVHQAIAASVMVTGQALRAMKPQMPHGAFEAWWRNELGLKDRKLVSDLMAASELLEQQAADTPLAALPPRTLAILQRAGSGLVLEEAVSRLDAGQKLTEVEARRIAANGPSSEAVKPSVAYRLLGYIDDERSATLARYVKGSHTALARFKALEAAADLDPLLCSLNNDERIQNARGDSPHPLAKLMDTAAREYLEAHQASYDFRSWCAEHPTDRPDIDSPLWAEVAKHGCSPLPDVYRSLRQWAMEQAKQLEGHRDPEGALRLWLQEIANPRDRIATQMELVMARCLDPWQEFAAAYMDGLIEDVRAKRGE